MLTPIRGQIYRNLTDLGGASKQQVYSPTTPIAVKHRGYMTPRWGWELGALVLRRLININRRGNLTTGLREAYYVNTNQ